MFDRRNTNIILAAIFCLLLNISSFAQTSEFTFQGKLTDQNAPANGVYDLSFKLYDNASLQIGSTVARDDVQVSNGVFTVTLDFALFAAATHRLKPYGLISKTLKPQHKVTVGVKKAKGPGSFKYRRQGLAATEGMSLV